MNTMPIQKPFCTTREAARRLGVSLRTAQLWVESSLLTAWKTAGGHRRITIESVESLLEKRDLPRGKEKHGPDEQTGRGAVSILVVEDDPLFMDIYSELLVDWSIRPRLIKATNGFDALIQLGREKPDLLITDLEMPGMDGFEMLRALQRTPNFAESGVIVVTALGPDEVERRQGGVPAGIPVLHKPIEFDRLERIALGMLARHASVSSGES